MKIFSSTLFSILFLLPSKNVLASGIPTIDISALVQNIVSYSQDLKGYSEDLYQSQVVANEYVQKLKQMEQMYKEYDHYLKQIEGIKDYVDENEWKDILNAVDVDFPINPLDPSWDVDIYTQGGVKDVDLAITNTHDRIRDLDDVYNDIETTFSSNDMRDQKKEEARRHFLKSRQATEQEYSAKAFTSQLESLQEALILGKQYREDIAMGDESELRTLQTLAMQKELGLEYLQLQNEVLVKSLEMANQESIERKNRASFIYDMQLLDMLEISNQTPYTPNVNRNSSANF